VKNNIRLNQFTEQYNYNDIFSSIQLRINWKHEQVEGIEHSCLLSAQSPAPSNVQNLSVKSLKAISSKVIEVFAEWERPGKVNGLLSNYQLCLSAAPLKGNELPSLSSSSCHNISVSLKCTQPVS